ncbi:MAG TPA: YdcF family protein, partial [Edaphobacter sp.]|nr:YdcF family protein [Edaphobacter sp.]
FAASQGVPASDIFEEAQAQDTIQNIYYSAKIMHDHGWSSAEVVSSPYHLGRASLILMTFNQRQPQLNIDWRTHGSQWPPEYTIYHKVILYTVESWRCQQLRFRGFRSSRFLPLHAAAA